MSHKTAQELNLTVLQFVANRLRDRDSSTLLEMGFGPAELDALGKLRLTEFSALARRMPDNLIKVELDRMAFHLMLDMAKKDVHQQMDLTSALLERDASQQMMQQLFGMSARDYARLRKALDLPPVVGRPTLPSEDDARTIWYAWKDMNIDHPRQAQPKDWLTLCTSSGYSAGIVWRLVWRWYEEEGIGGKPGREDDL